VPKALRDQLGLAGGQEVDVEARDGRLEIEAAPTPMRLGNRGGRVAAVARRRMPTLNAEQVRETLERVRR